MYVCKSFMTLSILLAVGTTSYAAQITLGQNAIVNGDAEAGVGSSDGSVVPVPGWTVSGQFTAVQYGAPGGFPLATDPGPTNRGNNFFAGGPSAALSTGTQLVDVSNISSQINAGLVAFALSGYLGGFDGQNDNAILATQFLNGATVLGTSAIGPVTDQQRAGNTELLFETASGVIPVSTTSIEFSLALTRVDGSYDDGYADNLSFVATEGQSPVAPEPGSFALMSALLVLGGVAFLCRRILPNAVLTGRAPGTGR
jgi:hypothetical protein